MNKKFIVFCIILCGIAATLATFVFAFVISGGFAILIPDPPKPQVTYGEFPFSITYEVNNEIKTYEDAIICEYDGVENLGTGGKRRKWKARLKSGNERVTLFRIEEEKTICEITLSPGLPEYYMGDFAQAKTYYESNMQDDRYLGCVEWNEGKQTGYSITKEEVYKRYKLRIIKKQFSEPIENDFGDEDM